MKQNQLIISLFFNENTQKIKQVVDQYVKDPYQIKTHRKLVNIVKILLSSLEIRNLGNSFTLFVHF